MRKQSQRPSNPSLQFMSFTPKPRRSKLGGSDIFEVSLRRWPAVAKTLDVPLRKRFKDEGGADTYCAALVAALQDYRQGRRTYRGPRDLETLQALYVRALRAEGRALRTIQATERRLSVFSTVLDAVAGGGAEDITGLQSWQLQGIKTALSESPYDYGVNYLHNTMATIHGFLAWCVHPQGAIEVNPAKGLVPPRGDPKRLSLSLAQRAQLRDVAEKIGSRCLDLFDGLGDVKGIAGDIAGVGDLLLHEGLGAVGRMKLGSEMAGCLTDGQGPETGSGPVAGAGVEGDADDRYVAA